MQSQLQSFQSVRASFWVTDGRGKDTKRSGLLLKIVLFIICFAIAASPLFLWIVHHSF